MSSKTKTTAAKEGPASVLVPKLRFPEFRGAWEKITLDTLGYFTGGGTPSKDNSAYWTGEIPWISSSDLNEDSISQINISRFITKQAVQESATKLVPAKSILLISRVGVGKLAVSTFPLCTSQDFTNFTPTDAEPLFLAYLLKSRKETLLSFNQGTSIKGFTKDNIASLRLAFPSPAEQQKIAECLSSLDELMAAQARKVDALKTHKKGLMQQLFPGAPTSSSAGVANAGGDAGAPSETQPRLRFPEFRNAGGWEVKRLSSEVHLISGMHLSPDQYSTTGEVPYFTGPSDFTNDIESVTKWTKCSTNMAAPDDTLITVKGSGVGEVWCSTLQALALGRQLMAIRAKQGSSQFIFQFLLTKKVRFEDLGSGNLIPGLSRTDILDMETQFPSPTEQQRIASCLSSLDTQITAETQKLEALKTHKKGLMQQLFPSPDEVAA
jgi:type I restriction enzyme, S subunit